MLDLHVHLIGHQDRQADETAVRGFLQVAIEKGLVEIGFADHDLYFGELDLPLLREVGKSYPGLKVRVGLEVDYRPGEEEKIQGVLERFPFDYVIGSVHEIEGWAFDSPGEEARHRAQDPDVLYGRYFSLVEKAARSGLFTTLGHLDLLKIYGVRPQKDILELADRALTAAEEMGLAIEINTNGRYKPVGEFYPEPKLLQEAVFRGISVTLGSDAHEAKVVGRDLGEAMALLHHLGAKKVVGFQGREPIAYSLI